MNLKYTPPCHDPYTLNNVRLTSYVAENSYDGDGFNRTRFKHTITGSATLIYTSDIISGGTIVEAAKALNVPRGKLELKFDDAGSYTTLANGSEVSGDYADAGNGPLPVVSVGQVVGSAGSSVLIVTFAFTFSPKTDDRVRRFGMTVSQEFDESGYITMKRTGTLVISAHSESANVARITTPEVIPTNNTLDQGTGSSPDLYRELITGKPHTGFRRIKQEFTVDPSLTSLQFMIEDKMIFRDLKYPVMSGDASFTFERGLDNMLGTKTFSASFEGEPHTPPHDILAVAIEAAKSRIDFNRDLVQSITIKEPTIYSRNKVELTVVAAGASADSADGLSDMALVKKIFSPPHTSGDTKWVSAYPKGGVYINSVTGLMWDVSCGHSVVTSIVSDNGAPDSVASLSVGETPTDVAIAADSGRTTPDTLLSAGDGTIAFLRSTSSTDVDTGMVVLGTTGGGYEFPYQHRNPKPIITQTVECISSSPKNIPYPSHEEPGVVVWESHSVRNVGADAIGKPIYAIRGTRQIAVIASLSSNSSEAGEDRNQPIRVYSPSGIRQPRGLFAAGETYAVASMDCSGVPVTQPDYVIDPDTDTCSGGGP